MGIKKLPKEGDTIKFQLKSGLCTINAIGNIKEIRIIGGFTDYLVSAEHTQNVWVRKIKLIKSN